MNALFPWVPAQVAALETPTGYRDPFTGAAIDAAAAAAIRAEWQRIIDANRSISVACGMAWWKRARIAQFLWADNRPPLAFIDVAQAAVAKAAGSDIAVWPSRMSAGLEAAAGDRLVRIEDGFIRSIGLGADLHPPLSIVVDHSGIYYDPTRPSDLETTLATADFTPDLVARAEALIETIVTRGISKYESEAPIAASAPRARRTILVTGQVEDDMSVRLGGAGIASNLELLSGKFVIEVKQTGFNKATAVRALMTHPPFNGRIPVFIGDDTTDEPVFPVIPEFHGSGFSVGRRVPGVPGHFDTPSDVRRWLQILAVGTTP